MAEKKKTAKKGSRGRTGVSTVDPRAPLAPTQGNLTATLEETTAVVGLLRPPDQPGPSDLVDSLLHLIFAEGLPCSFGQAALHRIDTSKKESRTIPGVRAVSKFVRGVAKS